MILLIALLLLVCTSLSLFHHYIWDFGSHDKSSSANLKTFRIRHLSDLTGKFGDL
jgi:hypothetical protein